MKTSAALLCGLVGLTMSLSACDALSDDAGPDTIDQDVLTGDSQATARPTTADTDLSTSTGNDTDSSTATGTPNDSDASTATGLGVGDSDQVTATGGFGDDDSATASPGEAAAPTEAPDDAELPDLSLDPAEGAAGGDSDLLSTTVRIGSHPDFDRVVFDFDGEGTPGYRVSYVDSAVQDGSGATVDVDGDGILQVVMTGTRYPAEDEAYEGGPGTYSLDAAEEVEQVRLSGTFEGTTQAFIGIDDVDTPYRAFVLSNPSRLVVDVGRSN